MRFDIVSDSRVPFRIPRKNLHVVAKTASSIFKLPKNSTVSIILASAQKSQKLNKEFRKKGYIPDVLTFSYNQREGVLGEIVLVPAIVAKQANERDHSTQDEFTILVIHGIVHMMGFEHDGVSEAQKNAMKDMEKQLLSKVHLTLEERSY